MAVRFPRCWLSIGGARIACLDAKVLRQAQRSADTFTATLSITETAKFGFDIAKWADFEPADASIIMSTTEGDERTMITGQIDQPTIQAFGNTVTVQGRDKSTKLIEKKINQKKLNKKSTEIVGDLAKDAGLKAQTKGSDDNAGKSYIEDTAHLIADKSAFAAISGLAEREGFRWYVDGDTLYFEPDENQDGLRDNFTPPKPGEPATGSILDLTLGRNMNAARPHKVTVKSWHSRDKKLYSHTAESDGVGDPISYEHHHNGHKEKQIEKIAKSRLKNAIRHELTVGVRRVGDLSYDVRKKWTLSGTGTIYDQAYDIDQISFDMSWGQGFTMTFNCNSAKKGRDAR